MKLPQQQPANDNGRAIDVVPVFVELLRRHDLTRLDVLVYGMLVAYDCAGRAAPMRQMAPMLGLDPTRLSRVFKRLEDRGLIERSKVANRARTQVYVLRGPLARCA